MSSTPQPQGRFNRFQYLPVLSNRSIYSATPRHASNASSQGRVVPVNVFHFALSHSAALTFRATGRYLARNLQIPCEFFFSNAFWKHSILQS